MSLKEFRLIRGKIAAGDPRAANPGNSSGFGGLFIQTVCHVATAMTYARVAPFGMHKPLDRLPDTKRRFSE